MDEKTVSHCRCRSSAISLYLRVRSSRGIFRGCSGILRAEIFSTLLSIVSNSVCFNLFPLCVTKFPGIALLSLPATKTRAHNHLAQTDYRFLIEPASPSTKHRRRDLSLDISKVDALVLFLYWEDNVNGDRVRLGWAGNLVK